MVFWPPFRGKSWRKVRSIIDTVKGSKVGSTLYFSEDGTPDIIIIKFPSKNKWDDYKFLKCVRDTFIWISAVAYMYGRQDFREVITRACTLLDIVLQHSKEMRRKSNDTIRRRNNSS